MTFAFTGPGYYLTADGRKALVGKGLDEKNGPLLTGVIQGDSARLFWHEIGEGIEHPHRLTGPWVDPPAAAEPIEAWAIVPPGGKPCWFTPISYDAHALAKDHPGSTVVRLTDQPDAELLKAAEDVVSSPSLSASDSSIVSQRKIERLRAAVKRVGGR